MKAVMWSIQSEEIGWIIRLMRLNMHCAYTDRLLLFNSVPVLIQ